MCQSSSVTKRHTVLGCTLRTILEPTPLENTLESAVERVSLDMESSPVKYTYPSLEPPAFSPALEPARECVKRPSFSQECNYKGT